MKIYFNEKELEIASVATFLKGTYDFVEYKNNIFSEQIEEFDKLNGQYRTDHDILFRIFQEEVEELIAQSMFVELSNKLAKVFAKEPLAINYTHWIVEEITSKVRLDKKNKEQMHKLIADFILYISENYYDKKMETQLLATESLVTLIQFVNEEIFLNKQEIEFLINNQYLTKSVQINIEKNDDYKLESLIRLVRKCSTDNHKNFNGHYELKATLEAIQRSRLSKSPQKISTLIPEEYRKLEKKWEGTKLQLKNIIEEYQGLDENINYTLNKLSDDFEDYYLELRKCIQKVTITMLIIENLNRSSSELEIMTIENVLDSLNIKKYSFKSILEKWKDFENELEKQDLESMYYKDMYDLIDEYLGKAIDYSKYSNDFEKSIIQLLLKVEEALAITDNSDKLYLDIKKKLQQSKEDCLEYAKIIDMRLKNFLENRIY
ncbi:hypothetical protein ACTGV6_03330 [Streptococcus suis]|uniref:Uncharacterized protein n=2 Tax=Streptococcus suis TaxID=1307 RepID=A0A2Z4PIM5_STRSU|nr:hypothetical protein [Streptococcus suis]AWX95518.1 hypothetical protein BKM66_04960 [Streptococcus suis]AWX97467.1 hypothetical protein BKM67_05245 [Streptococcus suis]MBM0242584.1 hypothetical protein [Streptococcus suis]MBM7191549.1 hypothetical protein [Streptococcus suis]MBO3839180.1 hypothetical protein [Streptococcus suis]